MRGALPIARRCKRMSREVVIQPDVISAQIPILLSRRTLSLMGEVINFTNCPLRLDNGDLIQLNEQKSGHLSFPMDILSFQSSERGVIEEETIFAAEGVSLTRSEVGKLHLRTGRADAAILRQMKQNAGRVCGPNIIQEVVKDCPRLNSRACISPNIASRYLSPYSGFSVFLDICYPKEGSGRKFPHLAVVDAFSRFLICVSIESLFPTVVIASFGRNWMAFLGRPRFLMKDGGPGTRSKEREAFGSIYDMAMVINPPGSVNQMGVIERHLGILKIGIEEIRH